MAAPGKDLGNCPECDNKLALMSDTLFCHECRKIRGGGQNTLQMEVAWTDAQRINQIVMALAKSPDCPMIHHAGQVFIVENGALIGLNMTADVVERVRRFINLAEGALIRMMDYHETKAVIAGIGANPFIFPAVDLVVPRSVLYLNHEGKAVHTQPGFNGRIYQTGPEVAPANTGVWTEFIEMTPFASEDDRNAYAAWCLASVLPLEYPTSPLFVVHADGQEAGKTWLVKTLAWALGYIKARSMKLEKSANKFRRATIAAMKAGRVLLWDNVVGSGFSFIENDDLSEILTENYAECAALFRVGAEQVQNRHLWAMTMNGGRLCEDLATRAISCKLVYDPDHPGIQRRALYGEDHWQGEQVSRDMLAEILFWAQQKYNTSEHVIDLKDCRRPQRWHRLVRRMGYKVLPTNKEVREAGDFDPDWLLKLLGTEGLGSRELCERLKSQGCANSLGKAAMRGERMLGLMLVRAAEAGVPIERRHTMRGKVWAAKA